MNVADVDAETTREALAQFVSTFGLTLEDIPRDAIRLEGGVVLIDVYVRDDEGRLTAMPDDTVQRHTLRYPVHISG